MKDSQCSFKNPKFEKITKKALNEKFQNIWREQKLSFSDGKLTLYTKIKYNLSLEPYLEKLDFKYRRNITKLRISSHRLQIGTGRYEKIPRNERICKNCTLNETEDEIHFLLQCPKYNVQRENLLNQLFTSYPSLKDIGLHNLFLYIMSTEDDNSLNLLAKLLCDNLP